jgi:hypothetical protein
MADPRSAIETLLAEHLSTELGDRAIGRALAAVLVEDALTWRAPVVPLREIRTIIGFTFGNRMLANGNREPGPVNAALADLAVRLHHQTGARVWASWEVAEAIGGRLGDGDLEAIYPARDAHAEPRYLSTGAVVEAVLAQSDDATALGTVAVVAVRDHAWRCAQICRRHGLCAGVPEDWALPDAYDAGSGQPWTRDRLPYLLHELHCRALDHRDALLGAIPD